MMLHNVRGLDAGDVSENIVYGAALSELTDAAHAGLRRGWLFFFFQAEDGIRDHCVTEVQTCALPIFLHVSPFNSTIVEANVPPVSPVSSTSGTRNPSCFITCSAFAHDGNPEMLALVPVSGPSNSSIKRRTTVLFGQRTAMRPVPAVTLSGMRVAAFTTSVNPPGQNTCASRKNLRGASIPLLLAQ